MTFAHPAVLLLIPIALLVVWYAVRHARGADGLSLPNVHRLWADFRGLAKRPAATRRRRLRGVLLAAGAVAALLALARPQWGEVAEQSFDQSREVLLALDLSRSMLADDVSPTRLARARLLIDALLDQLQGERVGLLVFAGTAFTQSPLSADYEVLRDFLPQLDPSYLPQSGSNYEAMLSAAVQAFGQQGGGDRFLVVLSDGEAHDDGWQAMLPALGERGIRVIGLGIGTQAGGLVPAADGGALKDEQGNAVLSRLEPDTLQELANATGGTYREAATWVDIAALVDATVEQGRKGRYVEQRRVRLQDHFQWFLAPGLGFVLLGLWIDFPLTPLARARQTRGRRSQPASAPAVAALMALVAFQAPGLAWAAVSDPPPPPDAVAPQTNPLPATVAELIAKPALAASDYARLATETIEFASQPSAPRGAPRAGVLDDGLVAVDRGEHLDAQAADWPALRAELERLKKAKDEQQQEQQGQQDQQGQQEQQEQQGQQDQQGQQGQQDQENAGSQGGGEDQQATDENKASSGQGQGDGEENQAQPEAGSRQDDAAGESGEQKAEEPRQPGGEVARQDEAKPLEAAAAGLGDDAEPQQAEAKQAEQAPAAEQGAEREQPAQPGSRMVGGGRAMPGVEPQGDLALAEALARMEHVKEGDAPAVLFDRMNRAEGQPRPDPSGKDW